MCLEKERDANILLSLIKKHVAKGTEIRTDCWKSYINLNEHGYVHKTVNHSKEFVDSETGVNTQNIKSFCRWIRHQLSRGGIHTNKLVDYMCQFMWRRRILKLNIDPFDQLLKDVQTLYHSKGS